MGGKNVMDKIICNKCGAENDWDSRFCKDCGTSLEPKTISETMEDELQTINNDEQENQVDDQSIESKEDCRKGENIVFSKKKRFNKKLFIPIIIAIVIIVFLIAFLSSPKVTEIEAYYSGDTTDGTILDNDNEGIMVKGLTDNNEQVEISGWKIDKAATLETDNSSTVTIRYKNLTCDLTVECSDSVITGITAEYKGSREAGIVIDNSSNVVVKEIHKNGTETLNTSDWKLLEPVTLKADETSDITVKCGDFQITISVECTTHTLTGISATYDGETEEGTVIDENNSGIHVIASYKNGDTKEISTYEIAEPATLVAGETSTVIVRCENQECKLDVACTTLSEAQFKEKCESIAYSDLARNPDEYQGKYVKFTGKVVQTMEGESIGALRVNVTKGKYSYDDTVYVLYAIDSSNRVLEDDIVTFYGYSGGLYSYESVLGATITIPSVYAMYVDVN